MDGLNTKQIDKAISRVPGFLGAYPFDELPEKVQGDFSLVINTEVSTMPGDHWLALVQKEQKLYFLDSYGRNIKDATFPAEFKTTILKYIHNSKCKSNPMWLQQLTSNTCGYYTMYFIEELGKGSLNRALSIFSDNLAKNDKLVINYGKHL